MVAIGAYMLSCSSAGVDPPDDAAVDGMAEEAPAASSVMEPGDAIRRISELEAEDGVFGFDLGDPDGDASVPEVSKEFAKTVEETAETYESTMWTDFAFLLMDVESGRGYAYNIDEEFYGASSFKGPFLMYVCEEFLDTGRVTLDYELSNNGQGVEYTPSTLRLDDIANTMILHSDNTCYALLRQNFGTDPAYADWLETVGLSIDEFDYSTWYPHYTVRQAAMVWSHIREYIESDAEHAEWYKDLLSQTHQSTIREVLDADPGVDATVYNKAGWINDDDYAATIDNGIIYMDGHTYLLSVLSSVRYSEANYDYFVSLVEMALSEIDVLA